MIDRHRAAPLAVTVSGSFKRHLSAIQASVEQFQARGVAVLSPDQPTIVDYFGDFAFVQSDRRRSIKGIQNRHLSAIAHSDFLWLCCSDGYVGQSAAMEVGFAVAAGVPIYADAVPTDLTLRQYCTVTESIDQAIVRHKPTGQSADPANVGLLLAPEATLSSIRDDLSKLESRLLHDGTPSHGDPIEPIVSRARRLLTLPTTP